jgi:4-amino-4-deoxy-L-arabinose transferase-like glycosyltransferase
MAGYKRKTLESTIDFLSGISTGKWLFFLTCFAFFIRLYVVLNAVTLSVDSTIDLKLAEAFSKGDYRGGLDIRRPPLHPIFVSLAYPVFQDYELSARVISLIFGTLTIPLSFYLGRHIYNERVGLITAFFLTVHPLMVRYSGDTLTEGLYHFLSVTIVLLGLKALSTRGIGTMFLTGLFSVLAYLTKHVAIGFLIIISLWVIFHNFPRIREDWGKRLALVASGWVVFIFMAIPYLLFLYKETGGVAITGMSITNLLFRSYQTAVFTNSEHWVKFLQHVPEAFSIPFFILFLWGIFKRQREGFSTAEYFLITILAAFCLLRLGVNPGRRYFVQLMPMALVFAATGFCYLENYIKSRAEEKAPLIVTALLILITVILLPFGMIPLKAHRLPEKLAGKWLLETKGGGSTILSKKPIVAYYADGNFVYLYNGKLERVIKSGKRRGAEYLAGYPRKLRRNIPDFDGEEKRLLKEVKSFEGEDGEKFIIYRLSPGDG